jgi:hypothetical protein
MSGFSICSLLSGLYIIKTTSDNRSYFGGDIITTTLLFKGYIITLFKLFLGF